MASARVNMRIDGELWQWAGVYAAQRGSSRTAVVEAALRSFRDLAVAGVPDLGTGGVEGSVRQSAERRESLIGDSGQEVGLSAPGPAPPAFAKKEPGPVQRAFEAIERERKG